MIIFWGDLDLVFFRVKWNSNSFTDSLIGVYIGNAIATKQEKKKTINGLVVGIAFILTYMNCNFVNIYINGLHFSKVHHAEDICTFDIYDKLLTLRAIHFYKATWKIVKISDRQVVDWATMQICISLKDTHNKFALAIMNMCIYTSLIKFTHALTQNMIQVRISAFI